MARKSTGTVSEGRLYEPLREADADNLAGHPVPQFGLERHVFYWMTQIMARRDRQLSRELRRHQLRVAEWRVLAVVKEQGQLSLGAASVLAGLDSTTMSRTVDRMERARRIVRVSDTADMRVTRLALTAEGLKLYEQVWPIVSDLNRDACANLPEGSVPLLCLALKHMVDGLDACLDNRKAPDRDPA